MSDSNMTETDDPHAAYSDKMKKAIEFYEPYLVLVREAGDRGGEGHALANMGTAISFYEKAAEQARAMGYWHGEASVYSNLGLRIPSWVKTTRQSRILNVH